MHLVWTKAFRLQKGVLHIDRSSVPTVALLVVSECKIACLHGCITSWSGRSLSNTRQSIQAVVVIPLPCGLHTSRLRSTLRCGHNIALSPRRRHPASLRASFFWSQFAPQDIRATEVDKTEVAKSLRPGDIIRARVISLGDSTQYFLSTAENELGVRWAKSAAGAIMIPISWQVCSENKGTTRKG